MNTEEQHQWTEFWKYYDAPPNVNDVECYEWWRWGQTDDAFFGDDYQKGSHLNLQTHIVDTDGKVPVSVERKDAFLDPPESDQDESDAALAGDDRTIEQMRPRAEVTAMSRYRASLHSMSEMDIDDNLIYLAKLKHLEIGIVELRDILVAELNDRRHPLPFDRNKMLKLRNVPDDEVENEIQQLNFLIENSLDLNDMSWCLTLERLSRIRERTLENLEAELSEPTWKKEGF